MVAETARNEREARDKSGPLVESNHNNFSISIRATNQEFVAVFLLRDHEAVKAKCPANDFGKTISSRPLPEFFKFGSHLDREFEVEPADLEILAGSGHRSCSKSVRATRK